MHSLRTLTRLLVALLVTITLACSRDSAPTTAPTVPPLPPAPQAGLIGDLLGTVKVVTAPVQGLLACNVEETHSASRVVGPEGGSIRVGPHVLLIPPNALRQPVRIDATAPAGNRVAVEFQPHGLDFQRPTVLTMSYRECGLGGLLLKIVYVDDSNPDEITILEVLPSLNSLLTQTVTAKTDHFSKYMLAE